MLTESVQSRLDAWDLTFEGELVETGSSWLVPVRCEDGAFDTAAAMLKVAKPDSDERPGMALLQWWGGEGAVRVWRRDADTILMPRLDDRPALGNLDDFDDAGAFDILVTTTDRLHRQARRALGAGEGRPPPAGLIPLADVRRHVFGLPLAQGERLARWRAFAAGFDLGGPRPLPLHGDIHHGNLLHDPGHNPGHPAGQRDSSGGWVVIDPKGYVGHPGYDFANLFFNPIDQPGRVADPARMLRLAETIAAVSATGGAGADGDSGVRSPGEALD
ncbi:MAG: aminoglycoside phosphotransferase family protein, partial [Pseudomonadota bacterium]|nr:aminoglycoside phosphotransferase family protein [Pseudomonadota bacterium]